MITNGYKPNLISPLEDVATSSTDLPGTIQAQKGKAICNVWYQLEAPDPNVVPPGLVTVYRRRHVHPTQPNEMSELSLPSQKAGCPERMWLWPTEGSPYVPAEAKEFRKHTLPKRDL